MVAGTVGVALALMVGDRTASSSSGGGGVSGAGAEARQALPGPDHITAATLAELKTRMGRHGNTLSNLVRAVVLLDRPTIRTLAERIADEEIVARVEASPRGSKKLALPVQFLAEQDKLRTVAQQLATAALDQGRDGDAVLADRFAALARTCVACHSAYLYGRPGDPGNSTRH